MLELTTEEAAKICGGLISTGPWPSDPPLPSSPDNSFLIDQLMRLAEQQEIARMIAEMGGAA